MLGAFEDHQELADDADHVLVQLAIATEDLVELLHGLIGAAWVTAHTKLFRRRPKLLELTRDVLGG